MIVKKKDSRQILARCDVLDNEKKVYVTLSGRDRLGIAPYLRALLIINLSTLGLVPQDPLV